MSTDGWPNLTGFEDTDPAELDGSKRELQRAHDDPLAVLRERYPRIHRRIVLLWGSQELADQLNRWLFTDQTGRQGFDSLVGTALLNIALTHEKQFRLEGSLAQGVKRDRW